MHVRRSLALMAVSSIAAWCVPAFAGAAEKVGQAAKSAEKIDPTGTWTWSRILEGQDAQSAVTISYKDGKLIGLYKRAGHVVPITNARFENNELSFDADGKWNEQTVHGKFHGKLSHGRRGDEINGNIDIVIEDGSLPLAWIAHRGVDAGDLVGTWKLRLPIPHGATLEPHLTLTLAEGNLKGKYSSRFGDREARDLSLSGCDLSWTVEYERDGQTHKNVYKGRLEACAAKGSIKGTVLLDTAGKATPLQFTGERYTPKQEARKPSDRDGKPSEGKSSSVAPAARRVS